MKYFILFFLICFLATGHAQNNTNNHLKVELRAQPTPDGRIMLRWAPANFASFEAGNQYGYRLSRITYQINGQSAPISSITNPVILKNYIKPWTKPQWEALMEADSTDWPDLGAGSIYGTGFSVIDLNASDLMTIVDQNKEKQNRFSFGLFAAEQSFIVAQAMGLAFTDTTAQPNSRYLYKIELNFPIGNSPVTASIEVNTAEIQELPQLVLNVEPGDKRALLKWETTGLEKYYQSYNVERSEDGGVTWTVLNNKPLLFVTDASIEQNTMYFVDSLAQNGVSYQYRVQGRSGFGDTGPASAPKVTTGIPGPVEGLVISTQVQGLPNGNVQISWEFPGGMASQVQQINILRSEDIDKTFSAINSSPLPASVSEFIDQNPGPANYYIVEYTDINGFRHQSIATLSQPLDETPPPPPPAPVCICDRDGHVRITWPPVFADDLMGYRVFVSNNTSLADMQEITAEAITDTIFNFQVSMSTLSEMIYFSIRSVDLHENRSAFSPIGVAIRPDVLPPSPPVIREYAHFPEGIGFYFIASSSNDVVSYTFQRRIKGYEQWDDLGSFPLVSPKPFIDTSANSRLRYEYRLLATDEVPLVSASQIFETKPFDDGLRGALQALQSFKLGITPSQPLPAAVLLSWNYPDNNDPDLIGFQIMRAVGGDPLRTLAFIPKEQARMQALDIPASGAFPGDYGYVDFDVRNFKSLIQQGKVLPLNMASTVLNPGPQGVAVRYTVYAKYLDGGFSELSEVIVVW